MKALYIVDVQYDFLENGKLGITNSNEIIEPILELIELYNEEYDCIVLSEDWHPYNHVSFSEWPEHCIQYTRGACIHESILEKLRGKLHVLYHIKGDDRLLEEYSAINNYKNDLEYFSEIDVVGLATDYCVKKTVLDLLELGKKVSVILDACRGVNVPSTLSAISEMRKAGANIVGGA